MFIKCLCYFAFLAIGINCYSYEGEKCRKGTIPGVCVNIRKCRSAIEDIKHHRNPQICSFSGSDPVVCCIDPGLSPSSGGTTPKVPSATPISKPSSTTEAYEPPTYDYKEEGVTEGCPSIAANLTSQKVGRKAWDKCLEYQEKYIYPCETSEALTGELERANRCKHNSQGLIVGGTDAAENEFPHMVLLGFGPDPKTAAWICGGSLISEKFVLTAGHCTFSRDNGPVTFVRTGSYRRTELDLNNVYKIENIIKHPNYKSPAKYNDLALLETEKVMKLSQYVVPACLDTGLDSVGDRALATGWGLTEHRGDTGSEVLQKVTLDRFTSGECARHFAPERNMNRGYQESTQVCYGHRTEHKDTCQGDSGGPMQIYNKKIHCMYTVVGVTSFGKQCGLDGVPAIYTRVSAFVPWIERIVWP